MTHDPNRTGKWSIRELRRHDRHERERRLRNVVIAILFALALVAAFLMMVR